MAVGVEQVKVAVCDACGKRTYGDPGKEPAVLVGKATDNTGAQSKSADWAACSPKHVGAAVQEAIKKASVVSLQGSTSAWPASNAG